MGAKSMTTTPIQQPLISKEHQAKAISLLRSWRNVNEADAQEQKETGEYLIQALQEDPVEIATRA
jgi:hypothetical protein